MKKIFNFGKIACDNKNKVNLVSVEIELEDKVLEGKGYVFTACGSIWNANHTDIICGGQCLDTINKFSFEGKQVFMKIYRLWKKYHLNDLHAGTIKQEKALEEAEKAGKDVSDYEKSCEYLKSVGLYEVKYEGKPYKYGHAWLFRAIPKRDLEKIKKLFED